MFEDCRRGRAGWSSARLMPLTPAPICDFGPWPMWRPSEVCMMGSDRRNAAGRPAPPRSSRRADGLSAFLPSVREARAGAVAGWVSPETPRTVVETVHATSQFWGRTPSKRAADRAPGQTNNCIAPCLHHCRTCCNGTLPSPALRPGRPRLAAGGAEPRTINRRPCFAFQGEAACQWRPRLSAAAWNIFLAIDLSPHRGTGVPPIPRGAIR